ncbi:Arc family DNA-binding protein [Gluconobacter oxydans]|uniref:Arc family DNA-binding protein n=1 Tax=Gluconobacter oxydans TaxID=442 RepID=UPI0034645171
MARTDPQFKLRLPADLKAWVEESAKHNQRSLNAEIVFLLNEARQNARDADEAFSNDIRLNEDDEGRLGINLRTMTSEELITIVLNRMKRQSSDQED